jgi:GTPase SAR1 family protein
MSEASSVLPVANQAASEALRIVLFGTSGAGKTALLRALSQSSLTQQKMLQGRLIDTSRRLDELRSGDDEESATKGGIDGLQPYPVRFEPRSGAPHVEYLLFDTDGQAAETLLHRQKKLGALSTESVLDQALIGADAIILAVDASAPPEKLGASFVDLGTFLDLMETYRGNGTEISGLPVFLVLTKCDLLSRPGDTSAAWLERIEEHKHRLHLAFRAFLDREHAESERPFGRVSLHFWATAITRPTLIGSGASASRKAPPERTGLAAEPLSETPDAAVTSEPFGVAELFRQALDEARQYRTAQERSSKRLSFTVVGTGAALTAMLALIVLFLSARPPHPLKDRLPPTELDAAVRLAGSTSRLESRLRDLETLKNDPNFRTLPQGDRERVESLLEELQEYLQLSRRLDDLLTPESGQTLSEAVSIRVPESRREVWSHTEVVADLEALHAAADVLDTRLPLGWYSQLNREAQTLIEQAPRSDNEEEWADWQLRTAALLQEGLSPPFVENDPCDNSRVTFGMLLGFAEISQSKAAWEKTDRPLLVRLRNISLALGLAHEAAKQPLAVAASMRETSFQPADWSARVAQLGKDFPSYKIEFTLTGLPEKSTIGIREAARRRFEACLPVARGVIRSRFWQAPGDGNGETVKQWQQLRDWLRQPKELADWRIIADILLGLNQQEAKDPIGELSSFLGQDSFAIELKSVVVEIPMAAELSPGRELKIFHPGQDRLCCTLTRAGEAKLDEKSRTWGQRYDANSTEAIHYRPGDHLSARLLTRDSRENEVVLTWGAAKDRGRSVVYQFQSLFLSPFQHRDNQEFDKGRTVSGAALRIGEGQCPRVPDLFPNDLNKR